MNEDLMRSITTVAERLVNQAAQDDGLRDALRTLARSVLEATERPLLEPAGPLLPPEPGTAMPPATDAGPPNEPLPEIVTARPPLPELTLGRSRPPEAEHRPEPPAPPTKPAPADADLPAFEAHCRLKAEGIRWAATRRRRLDDGAEFRLEVAPRDREIIERAGDLGCYLWMSTPDFAFPREPALLENVAGCFEAVADGLALIREMLPNVESNREFFEPALDVLAEAQSALRVAIEKIDGPKDPDQFRVYDWLRGMAAREQIYIRSHMRLDDPADPANLPDIEGRIEALDTKMQEVQGRAKRRKSHFNRLRYHARLIAEATGNGHDWRKVVGAIDDLMGEGVPPSNVEIREVLLPMLDRLPDLDEPPPGFGLVLREIDRYLASRIPTPETTIAEAPSAQVVEVAELLKGKSVLLIGGVRRPEAHQALKAAFGLDDLIWFETREHESIDVFEPYVARSEVALVLLAIRWSSHSYEGVKRFCERHGKPMVRLPGGYNPNQVAAQILSQCGERLGGD